MAVAGLTTPSMAAPISGSSKRKASISQEISTSSGSLVRRLGTMAMSSKPYARRPDLPLPISISTLPASRAPRCGLGQVYARQAQAADKLGQTSSARQAQAPDKLRRPTSSGARQTDGHASPALTYGGLGLAAPAPPGARAGPWSAPWPAGKYRSWHRSERRLRGRAGGGGNAGGGGGAVGPDRAPPTGAAQHDLGPVGDGQHGVAGSGRQGARGQANLHIGCTQVGRACS